MIPLCSLGFLLAWWLQTSYKVVQSPTSVFYNSSQGRSCIAFQDLASEVTLPHFCCILSVPGESQALPGFRGKGIRCHFLMKVGQSSERACVGDSCHLWIGQKSQSPSSTTSTLVVCLQSKHVWALSLHMWVST